MKKIFSILITLIVSLPVFAVDYAEGKKAFSSGDYQKATDIFGELLKRDSNSAALLYDLGTAYAAQGNLGLGRLYLERAGRIDPGNGNIRANLEYVSSRVDDANRASMTGKRGSVEPDARGFLGDMHHTVASDYTSNYWAAFAVMAFILCLGSIALYLFPSNISARKVGFFGALLFLFFTGVFLTFSVMAANQANSREYGIITAYKYELLEEPESKSKPACSPLTQGTKVRIVSEESDVEGNVAWYKVRLNSGYLGWIPASDLEVI